MISYAAGIHSGFDYLLSKYPDLFVIGQGLWSPWYVGSTMDGLEKKYGKNRVIDSPVSEAAVTGAAIGAALVGKKSIVVHPRMDFLLYAMDPIINQAAKWNYMLGGNMPMPFTLRAIINRGGEQGAQHSQALHSFFSHIPGLITVMPSRANDGRDLLIASALSPNPVIYIDDRWLYEMEEPLSEATASRSIFDFKPKITNKGEDITIVGCGFSSALALKAARGLSQCGVSAEVIDLRVVSPVDHGLIISSVQKTRRLVVVDGGWKNCGMSAEIIAKVCETIAPNTLLSKPKRITIAAAPAPTSSVLEKLYYPSEESIRLTVKELIGS